MQKAATAPGLRKLGEVEIITIYMLGAQLKPLSKRSWPADARTLMAHVAAVSSRKQQTGTSWCYWNKLPLPG